MRILLGLAVGGALGWAYAVTIGCSSGACSLTSQPLMSAGFGAMFGFMATAMDWS